MGFILSAVHLALVVIAMVQMLQSRNKDSYKILWALIIIFLPWVGPILWFALGDARR